MMTKKSFLLLGMLICTCLSACSDNSATTPNHNIQLKLAVQDATGNSIPHAEVCYDSNYNNQCDKQDVISVFTSANGIANLLLTEAEWQQQANIIAVTDVNHQIKANVNNFEPTRSVLKSTTMYQGNVNPITNMIATIMQINKMSYEEAINELMIVFTENELSESATEQLLSGSDKVVIRTNADGTIHRSSYTVATVMNLADNFDKVVQYERQHSKDKEFKLNLHSKAVQNLLQPSNPGIILTNNSYTGA